jgi:YHS domain-containing protein
VVHGARGETADGPRVPTRGVELVRDPVCRTYLPRAQALQAQVAGRVEFFCSPACRDQALDGRRDPAPALLE